MNVNEAIALAIGARLLRKATDQPRRELATRLMILAAKVHSGQVRRIIKSTARQL